MPVVIALDTALLIIMDTPVFPQIFLINLRVLFSVYNSLFQKCPHNAQNQADQMKHLQ